MIHPIKSIIARRQGYIINHYDNSKYAQRLRSIKGIHKGQRCFIVANGPSLTSSDLNLLQENKEITFGMNRIFKIFDDTKWRPTYYVCEDINIFNECVDEINNIPAEGKFIPINHHFYDNINIEDAFENFGKWLKIKTGNSKDAKFVDGFVTNEADLTDEMFAKAKMHDEDGAWQMIFGVNTVPAHRRHGYAGQLIERSIADAKAQGRKGLVLTCKPEKVAYYAKFGFADEGVSENSTHGGVVWHQMRLTF